MELTTLAWCPAHGEYSELENYLYYFTVIIYLDALAHRELAPGWGKFEGCFPPEPAQLPSPLAYR
jgi:hypothetical protein